ncbi:MAG: type II toxin-antitoxin system PemK/MazF family toxin [Proteobacteria bacterium]|nr:type II toxin-antitoxin system PemK/MazF family toxin [Pseudomonadota bacterium]
MTFNFKRGEVYLVQETPMRNSGIENTRPWVLFGANPVNRARRTIIAIPLSTQVKEISGFCIKVCVNGIYSYAVLDQIRALDKTRFIRHEGMLTQQEISLMEDGLRQILCL